ncbi:hypothetical protein ACFRCG_10695 [Embleya sp. NPDC056575]|uniref:hypothetical protein n=1 Tax=unclassified Embleya TaxID=2699296 RepID=UPI003686427C
MSGPHAQPEPTPTHGRQDTPVFDALSNEWIAAGRELPWETPAIPANNGPGPHTLQPGTGGPAPVPAPRTGHP